MLPQSSKRAATLIEYPYRKNFIDSLHWQLITPLQCTFLQQMACATDSPKAMTLYRFAPSHPLLVPIERIAPGVPEDDDLIQEFELFL
jgi:hypothetical protein